MPQPYFGGISGLVVSDDGTQMTALSDSAFLVVAQIERQNSLLTGLGRARVHPLHDASDARLKPGFSDSEGLARLPGGDLVASFEDRHRLERYAPSGGPATRLAALPVAEALGENAGIEALATDAGGAIYAIPERSGRRSRPFPVYRLNGETWDVAFSLPRRGPFLPVGADIFEDRLYLLERDFNGIGFRTRLRRFDMTGSAEEVLLKTRTLRHDNLEGIAIWRDAAGDLRATMVSDDNYRWLQRTEIVEYRLPD